MRTKREWRGGGGEAKGLRVNDQPSLGCVVLEDMRPVATIGLQGRVNRTYVHQFGRWRSPTLETRKGSLV